MAKPDPWEHKFHSCDDHNCYICNGGLRHCDVCNCSEGSLLTFCPGEHVTANQQDLIMRGWVDYHPYVGWFKVAEEKWEIPF